MQDAYTRTRCRSEIWRPRTFVTSSYLPLEALGYFSCPPLHEGNPNTHTSWHGLFPNTSARASKDGLGTAPHCILNVAFVYIDMRFR